MKKSFKISLMSIFLMAIIITSCSIQKRHYMPGYHINRIGHNPTSETQLSDKHSNFSKINIEKQSIETEDPVFLASEGEINLISNSKENEIIPIITNTNKNSIKSKNQDENECDLIILRNGDEITAKVLEVGENEVKYLQCDNLNGPTFTLNKSKIFKIKFANGSSTVFEETSHQNNSYNNNSSSNNSYDANSYNANDRNLLVAVILWALFGMIGIHRFYLGHIGMGILYLFTGGLCGIGWIIDGIMFLTGSLQPKNGKYVK